MAVNRIPKSAGAKNTGPGSQQLEHTLKELGNAFADWESLAERKPEDTAAKAAADPKVKAAEQAASEFQKRTATLLDQLREQLSELTD